MQINFRILFQSIETRYLLFSFGGVVFVSGDSFVTGFGFVGEGVVVPVCFFVFGGVVVSREFVRVSVSFLVGSTRVGVDLSVCLF